MKQLFSLNDYYIFQDERKKTLFYIKSKNNNENIYLPQLNSILKSNLIHSGSIINKEPNYFLIINAVSIKSFLQYKEELENNISYTHIQKIIYCLSNQLQYLLQEESKCFYTYDVNNVIVLDNSKFFYLCNEHLKEVKNSHIHIYHPIQKNNRYLSPELIRICQIPIIIDYKTIFYSLGLLIISILKNEKENLTMNSSSELLQQISFIKDSKIYHFLHRCLYEEPKSRFLIYI